MTDPLAEELAILVYPCESDLVVEQWACVLEQLERALGERG